MKALGHVREYGGRKIVALGYARKQLHFEGKEPEAGSVILVDIPEVKIASNALGDSVATFSCP